MRRRPQAGTHRSGDFLGASAAEPTAGLITTGALRLGYCVLLLVQLCLGVLLGILVTGTPLNALFDAAATADLPEWALILGGIAFTAGTVLAFAIPCRFFRTLLVLVYATAGVQSLFTGLTRETGAHSSLPWRRPSRPVCRTRKASKACRNSSGGAG